MARQPSGPRRSASNRDKPQRTGSPIKRSLRFEQEKAFPEANQSVEIRDPPPAPADPDPLEEPMKRLLGLIAVLLLALPVAATAQNGNGGQPQYWITGGGQVVLSNGDNGVQTGPGDTIAFNAQLLDKGNSDSARGQIQVNRRDPDANGRPTMIFHGQVECVIPGGFEGEGDDRDHGDVTERARFGGSGVDRRDGQPVRFVVDVVDNGQGQDNRDFVAFREFEGDDGDSPCEDEADDTFSLRSADLARGNVKIHHQRYNGGQ
jgi:hypothetical protein